MRPSRLYLYRLVTNLLPETRFFKLKAVLLRWCGAKIGSNVRINSSAIIQGNGSLEIGNDVWIGPCVHIMTGAGAAVSIGSCVDIAPHVYIGTGSHEIAVDGCRAAGTGFNKSITIGNGVWLCARVVVLPGVSVGGMAVVAAGAVVAHDVQAHAVSGGVPCRKIRDI